jgi:hypothetical protein
VKELNWTKASEASSGSTGIKKSNVIWSRREEFNCKSYSYCMQRWKKKPEETVRVYIRMPLRLPNWIPIMALMVVVKRNHCVPLVP